MSETTSGTYVFCEACGHIGDERDYTTKDHPERICVDSKACERRQKRNTVLAEMQEMAKKPYQHPIDRFSKVSLYVCGAFLLTIIFVGLLFLNGF
ncbi:membrane protein [Arthrobacter phage Truckee]|nr:membrane protein [Arthrobacter phage Truckee]